MVRRLLLAFVTTVLALPAHASDIEMVISRNDSTATLYVRGSLALMLPVFGVDFLDGGAPSETTSLNAGDLLAKTLITTPSGPIPFEQMAAMAHPSGDPLLFDAPWDASTAMSLRSEVNSNQPITSATHDLYAGYVARNIDGLAEISFIFPAQASSRITLTIRDHSKDQIASETTINLAETQVLVLASAEPSPLFRAIFFASFMGFMVSLALLYLQRYRQDRQASAVAK
jgi:hypothetical protein